MATASQPARKTAFSAPPEKAQKPGTAPGQEGLAGDFLSAFEGVVVLDPMHHLFDGAISREHALWFWHWIARDVITDIEQRVNQAIEGGSTAIDAIEKLLPEILAATKGMLNAASHDPEADRRLTVQLGGEEVRERLPTTMNAIHCRPLIAKARSFGKAANNLTEDHALGNALRSMPIKEPKVFALLMQAMVGQVANPSRLSTCIVTLSDGAAEDYIRSAGYGPLIDALLAHAQDQVNIAMGNAGAFADYDLSCRAVERFHRLMRAVNSYVEMNRNSRWADVVSDLTRRLSAQLEPRMRDVSADVSQALRKPREGADRVDSDRLLAALNGLYLLSAIRDARDSLALNAVFEKVWNELSQTLEVLLKRNLEDYRADPVEGPVAERLDVGIKMAEIRFNPEYADIIRKARDAARRRSA